MYGKRTNTNFTSSRVQLRCKLQEKLHRITRVQSEREIMNCVFNITLLLYSVYKKKKATLNIHGYSRCFTVQKTFGPLGFEKACNRIISAQLSKYVDLCHSLIHPARLD